MFLISADRRIIFIRSNTWAVYDCCVVLLFRKAIYWNSIISLQTNFVGNWMKFTFPATECNEHECCRELTISSCKQALLSLKINQFSAIHKFIKLLSGMDDKQLVEKAYMNWKLQITSKPLRWWWLPHLLNSYESHNPLSVENNSFWTHEKIVRENSWINELIQCLLNGIVVE